MPPLGRLPTDCKHNYDPNWCYACRDERITQLEGLLRALLDYLDSSPAASAMHWCEEIEKALGEE